MAAQRQDFSLVAHDEGIAEMLSPVPGFDWSAACRRRSPGPRRPGINHQPITVAELVFQKSERLTDRTHCDVLVAIVVEVGNCHRSAVAVRQRIQVNRARVETAMIKATIDCYNVLEPRVGRALVERARELGARSQESNTWTPGDPELAFGLYGPGQ